MEKVEFLWDRLVVSLQIANGSLQIKCLKKLNLLNPRSLASFNKQIPFIRIISVESYDDLWKIDTERLLDSGLKSFLHNKLSQCSCLSIYFYKLEKNHHQKLHVIKLQTHHEKDARGWQESIKSELDKQLILSGFIRPKKLLVFVNPFGGEKKGESLHSSIVARLFKIAGIEETVVITQYKHHAKEYVQKINLNQYDGVVAVGGDGMLNELVNGVLIASQITNKIPLNGDKISLLTKPISYASVNIKLGFVPAGSTNCLSYVSQGTVDPETATLQIICGENHPIDVCSIHDDEGSFLRFSFTMTSYGFFGDVIKKSENLRKFGPKRYSFAGIDAFANIKSYSSEVAYLLSSPDCPVDISVNNTKCSYPCEICFNSTSSNFDHNNDDCNDLQCGKNTLEFSNHNQQSFESIFSNLNGWNVTKGRFVMVNSAMMSCACVKCPQGLSPSAHLSDGNVDLILVRSTWKPELLKYLLSHSGNRNRFNFPFVEAHRVKGFHHRSIPDATCKSSIKPSSSTLQSVKHGSWNSDGELMDTPNITLWVHNGLISIFARECSTTDVRAIYSINTSFRNCSTKQIFKIEEGLYIRFRISQLMIRLTYDKKIEAVPILKVS